MEYLNYEKNQVFIETSWENLIEYSQNPVHLNSCILSPCDQIKFLYYLTEFSYKIHHTYDDVTPDQIFKVYKRFEKYVKE